jgi:hypothetical protein
MKSVTATRLHELLARAQIDVSADTANVGKELIYRSGPHRTIVIHLGETDSREYCIELFTRVLALDADWLLLTRYGSVADLGLMPDVEDAAALEFSGSERAALATYLCTRSTRLSSISADLYVLDSNGEVLVTWDHHSADEGISVAFQSVATAGRLLVSLNELGAELEVFTNG